jgi:hypothetical protein
MITYVRFERGQDAARICIEPRNVSRSRTSPDIGRAGKRYRTSPPECKNRRMSEQRLTFPSSSTNGDRQTEGMRTMLAQEAEVR